MEYTRSFKEDYKTGKSKENEIKNKLESVFGQLKKTINICKYDYYNDDYIIEVKSRLFNKDKYPTTMIACDKILETEKNQIFVFNFLDGLYYIKYCPSLFEEFEKNLFQRRQRIDHKDIKKLYCYIPINKLIKI